MEKTQTYCVVICSVCKFKTVGNWEVKQLNDYYQHYIEKHVDIPVPIIKKEKR